MEILQFAITMEQDGEKYYRQQAARNANNALRIVFDALAADEARHAKMLQSKADGVSFELEAPNDLSEQMNLFKAAGDFRSTVEALPDQLEPYQAALTKEQQSITLYKDLLAKATDDLSRDLFALLLEEENNHHALLEELYHHLNRPNEWVESAEFGVREDY